MVVILHDCDPTLFCPHRDPDDSLAIGFGLRGFSDDSMLAGITTVYGNASIEKTFRTAQRIVRVSKSRIPVRRGAGSRADLGHMSDATMLIMSMAREYGEIEILATGPLTNIATALLLYPELQDHVRRIVIMGGALFRRGNMVLFDAEFNFWMDPLAARIVIRKIRNIIIAPLDVTLRVRWGMDISRRLIRKRDRLARFLGYGIRPWSIVWSLVGGFNPHDTIAAIYMYEPKIYHGIWMGVEIGHMGKTIATERGKKVFVLLDLDKERFKEIFLEAFY